MGGTFGTFQQSIGRIAVWYLRQRNIATFLEAVGLTLDGATQTLYTGLDLSNPLRCPSSQLPVISADRKIRIYQTEPDASKRYRLAHWRQLRRTFGSHYGEMLNIQPFFLGTDGLGPLPTIRIVHQSGFPAAGGLPRATWHTLAPDGTYSVVRRSTSNWNWDGVASKWSRWWCIIYLPPGFVDSFNWDSGPSFTWDSGLIWDGVPAAVFADLFGGLTEAKAAHSRCCGLITTSLQPTDDIPGLPGVHPFDPESVSTTNADGSTNLPIGNWGELSYSSGPNIGRHTRAPWATFYNWTNG